MQENQIIPWEIDDTMDEFYVPAYIEDMALEVVKEYDMSVHHMEVITTKEDKGGLIWKIDTDKGPRSLKILHRRPSRSLFSIGAQEYLVHEKKARIPVIIKTNQGETTVLKGGKIWFVAEWIEPLEQVSEDLEGAKHLCRALGEFHFLSKGYKPPKGAEVASRLHRWPKTYQKVINKMEWFENIAQSYQEMPASSVVLQHVDLFKQQAVNAKKRLDTSSYKELTARGNQFWGLVHQDYGWSNGQMGAEGMWIIDLDGVAYDLPIRDLRKLITGTMDDMGTWDVNWIIEMTEAYNETNPIEEDLYDMLLIDMSLPNEFYKNVKEMVYQPELFLDQELAALIETIVVTDQSKWPAIQELSRIWKRGEFI
ncbi:CotS family spore coat protein [Salipaludibacillus sp. HK11]|uniref:CotS family spore coat protein n=1 Tax=Salipaludibacillus sp. HK11 TaxID=3394320 RepID=UPI0039FD4EE7